MVVSEVFWAWSGVLSMWVSNVPCGGIRTAYIVCIRCGLCFGCFRDMFTKYVHKMTCFGRQAVFGRFEA